MRRFSKAILNEGKCLQVGRGRASRSLDIFGCVDENGIELHPVSWGKCTDTLLTSPFRKLWYITLT